MPRVALITGASRGIGAATAWTLLSAGDAPEMARFGKGHYSLLQPRQ